MSDNEVHRLHERMGNLEKSFKEHDKKNGIRFEVLRKALLGDEVDTDKPGVLRRIQSLEAFNRRMIRNAQATWGFLLVVFGAIISQLTGLFGGKQ